MTRNDTHKPSLLDPAEYDFQAAFYQGDSDWMYQAYREDMKEYDDALSLFPTFEGNFERKNTCDHCGAAFNHGVLFLHVPTDELIHVGHICASNTVGLPDRAAAARKKAEKFHKEQEEIRKLREAGAEWRERCSDLVAFLEALPQDANYFIKDMQRAVERWGKLTPGQEQATRRFIEREAKFQEVKREREAALKDAPALTAGRQALAGKILSTKLQDSDYGTSLKMLVELPDGNRVFGTVPASLDRIPTEDMPGKRVNFTATVKPSDKDPHFGYFSRPANASYRDRV